MPEHHVLHDVEVVGERQVLVDGGDPRVRRVLGRAEVHRLALPDDLAAVGLPDAGDRLDQRRLARAVVADQGGDLAGGNV